ncbi:MAG: heavy metal translocating P-type ATPase [Rudaea sp.]
MPHADNCFHCGEPIEVGGLFLAKIRGRDERVCCVGCQAAAEWIVSLGLSDYYRLRSLPAERAADVADFSAWDRSQMQRLYVRDVANGCSEAMVLVEGMRCAACSWLIERALRGIAGVRELSINPAAKRLHVTWARDATALSTILARVARLGYTPRPLDAQSLDATALQESRAAMKRLIVAGLGMMQAMMYAVALYAGAFDGMDPATRDFFRWLGLLVTTPVVFYSARPFFLGALRELRARLTGMDTTIALAIALIYAASLFETVRGGAQVYFDSASMFVFLLLGGRYLEMRGRQRATDIVDALARLQPALAQRRQAGGLLETVGVHELETGDVVLVASGDTVPADGALLGERCEVDESLLTGESRERLRRRGDTLIAGSIVRTGPAEIRVAQIGAETILSGILRLITKAQAQRPRAALLSDRIAARFVAGVLTLALLTALGWYAIEPSRAFAAALAVLVVSCPCAFALSVPIAYLRAASSLARMGVLMTRSDALEKLASIDRVVFDKTGTLTENRLELARVETLGGRSVEDCLRIAAALEESSAHPFAAAIRDAARTEQRPTLSASAIQTSAGAGVEGHVDGVGYRIGRGDFAHSLIAGAHEPSLDDDVLLVGEQGPLARLHFRETLRCDAPIAIDKLRAQGMRLGILSGDCGPRVAAVAARLGIPDFHPRLSPAQKLKHLQDLRAAGSVVAMVGDGVNDAPVLAGADVAIALGGGTQLAQAGADIVLASDRLDAIAASRDVALHTLRILRQNLYWAFAYNFICIPLAALGFISPWLAAIGMSASSLLVVLNSLRITPLALPLEQPREAILAAQVLAPT